MKRSAFDEKRDQITADRDSYAKGYTPELMCSAHGCPNRWSVDSNDRGINRLCSAHAWEPSHRWPEITQQQQWNETERVLALQKASDQRRDPTVPLTLEQKRATLLKLGLLGKQS